MVNRQGQGAENCVNRRILGERLNCANARARIAFADYQIGLFLPEIPR